MVADSNMYMPVAPAYGGGNGGFGNGFGADGWWIILLLLVCGGGFGFGGFGGNAFAADGMALYPWMNQSNQISDGFRDQALNTTVNGIQNSITSGFGDVQNALCGGFAGVNASIANGFAQAEIGENARQMANMNQMFGLSQQIAQASCDNREATQDVKYTIATEASATRSANTANTQAILDKLCQLELDGVKAQVEAKNDRILELQSQLNMAALRESQTAQNAFISQGFANEVDQLYNRLSNCPVPSTPVYGRTPIFTCNQNAGCGCGM